MINSRPGAFFVFSVERGSGKWTRVMPRNENDLQPKTTKNLEMMEMTLSSTPVRLAARARLYGGGLWRPFGSSRSLQLTLGMNC